MAGNRYTSAFFLAFLRLRSFQWPHFLQAYAVIVIVAPAHDPDRTGSGISIGVPHFRQSVSAVITLSGISGSVEQGLGRAQAISVRLVLTYWSCSGAISFMEDAKKATGPTKGQQRVLDAIAAYRAANEGQSPSGREISRILGHKSPFGVILAVDRLIDMRLLKRVGPTGQHLIPVPTDKEEGKRP